MLHISFLLIIILMMNSQLASEDIANAPSQALEHFRMLQSLSYSSSTTTNNNIKVAKNIPMQSQVAANRESTTSAETQTDESLYCLNCCVMSYPEGKKKQSRDSSGSGIKDEDLKKTALQLAVNDLSEPCSAFCQIKGSERKCIQKCSLQDLLKVRLEFWGKVTDPTPNRSTRNKNITQLLKDAFDKNTKTFIYKIGERHVCEQAYFRAIGYINSQSKRFSNKFYDIRKEIIQPGSMKIKKELIKSDALITRPKFEHAVGFLRQMATFYAEPGYGENVTDVKFIPYDTLPEVFHEYCAKTEREESESFQADKYMAGREIFRQAYLSVKNEIRLRSSKGSFETCSVCNAFHEILKSQSSEWSMDKIDLVQKFKRLHLHLQSEERQDSKRRRDLARDSYDSDGNPLYAYFEADGYTKFKCLSPRNHAFRKVKGDTKRIGNNVIGIIVVCGPVNTRFVYSMDDLVENGANMMIEVMRQAFLDLGTLLADYKGKTYKMPRTAFLQFDNCGVNKNKYMFSYLSLLIERGHFDHIEVNFLIVGHTHTTIDQYFSVITRKLYGKFVGSPLALQYLFNECQFPEVNKQIHVQYDYRSWLQPVINNLHNYGLPHCFVFKRRLSKAICQHKPYSRSPRYFPVEPEHQPKDSDAFKSLLRPLRIENLSFIGGIDAIQETMGITNNINTKLLSVEDCQLFDQIKLLKDLIKPLNEIEAKVSCEISNKMDLQSEVGYLTTLTDDNLVNKVIDLTNVDAQSEEESPDNDEYISPDSDEDDSDGDLKRISKPEKRSSIIDDPSLAPKPVTREQLSLFSKTLEQFNFDEMGYLVWLNYDNVNEEWFTTSPNLLDYSTDPVILSKFGLADDSIKATATAINSKLLKPSMKRYNAIESAINNIVATSKTVIADAKGKFYETHEATVKQPFCYTDKKLAASELGFYSQCSTPKGVLDFHHQRIVDVTTREGTYTLFPTHTFSAEQLKDIEERRNKMLEEKQRSINMLNYVIGTRNSNTPYLDANRAGEFHAQVLSHTSKSTSKNTKSTESQIPCPLLNCGGFALTKCRAKECSRLEHKYCKLHAKHPEHNKKEFKPSTNTTSALLPITPAATTNATTTSSNAAISPSSLSQSQLCWVLECNEPRSQQCCECKIWACNLHIASSHESHRVQLLKEGFNAGESEESDQDHLEDEQDEDKSIDESDENTDLSVSNAPVVSTTCNNRKRRKT